MSLIALGSEQIARTLYRTDQVHRPIPHPNAFGPEQIEEYRTRGFIAIENVFTPREVDDAIAGLSHLIRGGNPDFKAVQIEPELLARAEGLPPEQKELFVRKIAWFVEFDARLKAMSDNPTLVRIVEALVGTKVTMTQDMALLKPPQVGTEKPWHQDTAYFLYEPLELVIGTWTALDPATIENGCMHVIAGSHLKGPRPHYHDRDCQLPDEDVDLTNDVVVPLKPGGTLFFSGLLHHGTPPNRSQDRRRALQFHYASVNCRKMTRETHEGLFKDEVGYATCTGWQTDRPLRPIATKPK
ncbi:MAG: phytanoyl-CoA dioxygenase family protein [Tepidisphaeraceae bacterium]